MTQEQAMEKVREWGDFYIQHRTTSREHAECVQVEVAEVTALLTPPPVPETTP